MRKACAAFVLMCTLGVWSAPAAADDLFRPGSWPAMASDRSAHGIGDVLTVLVYENSSAADKASSGSSKSSRLHGSVSAGSFNKGAGGTLEGGFDNAGGTQRSGQMVAQISVKVDALEPNGDLRVSGQQLIHINRQTTVIKVRGRVRTADVTPANTVLSSRLADAEIDYDGSGFVTRSALPGPLVRLFNWLGLM